MKARKIGLLMLILFFGAITEVSYQVHSELSVGPSGCRVLSGEFRGPSYDFTVEKRLSLESLDTVEVTNAFGTVLVEVGEPGEARLSLRKVVYLPHEAEARSFAEQIEIETEHGDSLLKVTTNRRRLERERDDVGFETDLTLVVPPGTALSVTNDHGRVEVTDVASARIESSYEPVTVERVAGAAWLRNRQGDITARAIGGALDLHAWHGSVEVEEVAGSASLEVDHGDVTMSRLADVTLKLDTGNATATSIQGDLQMDGTRASLRASAISGNAVVATTYRDVELSDVGGETHVRGDRGEVRLAQVKGATYAETSYDNVYLTDMVGSVEVDVSHGGLKGQGLAAGARIKSSGDDVVIDGFEGRLEIEAERGDVQLSAADPIVESITVTAPHGSIVVQVPEGSRFELEAVTASGALDVSVPGLVVSESSEGRAVGRFGGGGAVVELRAERGDVTLEPSAAKPPSEAPPPSESPADESS